MPHDLYNENRREKGRGGKERKIVGGGKRQVLKNIP